MVQVTLALHAMATRFELVLHGERESALRAAGEEALAEIERLENQLSLFRPTSEIANANALAARRPVRLSPPVFALLEHAQRLHQETEGAFDITIAPLLRCWGFLGGSGQMPKPEAITAAREHVGMQWVELDQAEYTVRFTRPEVMIDLGAIGKGYAVEAAVELLRDSGVESAFLHGGTSTAYALGTPPGEPGWKLAIDAPERHFFSSTAETTPAPGCSASASEAPLAVVCLKDQALSMSAVWGKCFRNGNQVLGHVLDPRTGSPASGTLLSVVVVDSATESDALSTALLVLGSAGHSWLAGLRPGMRTLLATGSTSGLLIEHHPGGWLNT